MTRRYILTIIGIGITCIWQVTVAAWGFVIDKYHVDMTLYPNWSMDIQETIDTNFFEKRHWIIRTIPIRDNAWDYTSISDITVIDAPVASYDIDNINYILKIWDPDEYVLWNKTYTITYTVENAIKQYLSWSNTTTWWRQELYWNIVWTKWDTTIGEVSFTISLPKKHIFWSGNMFLMYWYQWATGKNNSFVKQQISSWVIIWGVTQILQPNQWVTIWLQFPLWYFSFETWYYDMFSTSLYGDFNDDVSSYEDVSTISSDDIVWYIAFWWFIFLNILITVLINQSKYKKKNRKTSKWSSNKALTVYYTPPQEPLPPIVFGFWYFENNPKIFASLIYYRGDMWYIIIKDTTHKDNNISDKIKSYFKNTRHITTMDKKITTMMDKVVDWMANGMDSIFGKLIWARLKDFDNMTFTKTVIKRNTVANIDNINDMLLNILFSQDDEIEVGWYQYSDIEAMFNYLMAEVKKSDICKAKNFIIPWYTLTEKGSILFEQLRWYKDYLEKVEKPVLENELKNNPNYISKILPRATLFWFESRILDIAKDLMTDFPWYSTNSNSSSLTDSLSFLTTSLISTSTPPVTHSSSSSSSSWFSSSSSSSFSSSSSGWSSGWGGGWGGGSSW